MDANSTSQDSNSLVQSLEQDLSNDSIESSNNFMLVPGGEEQTAATPAATPGSGGLSNERLAALLHQATTNGVLVRGFDAFPREHNDWQLLMTGELRVTEGEADEDFKWRTYRLLRVPQHFMPGLPKLSGNALQEFLDKYPGYDFFKHGNGSFYQRVDVQDPSSSWCNTCNKRLDKPVHVYHDQQCRIWVRRVRSMPGYRLLRFREGRGSSAEAFLTFVAAVNEYADRRTAENVEDGSGEDNSDGDSSGEDAEGHGPSGRSSQQTQQRMQQHAQHRHEQHAEEPTTTHNNKRRRERAMALLRYAMQLVGPSSVLKPTQGPTSRIVEEAAMQPCGTSRARLSRWLQRHGAGRVSGYCKDMGPDAFTSVEDTPHGFMATVAVVVDGQQRVSVSAQALPKKKDAKEEAAKRFLEAGEREGWLVHGWAA